MISKESSSASFKSLVVRPRPRPVISMHYLDDLSASESSDTSTCFTTIPSSSTIDERILLLQKAYERDANLPTQKTGCASVIKKRKNKSVRFNLESTVVYAEEVRDNETYQQDDRTSMYYSKQELKGFMKEVKELAKELQGDVKYNQFIQELFTKSGQVESSSDFDLAACDDYGMSSWLDRHSQWLGLDCLTSRELNRDRCMRREEMMDRILDIQEEISQEPVETKRREHTAQKIQAACERISLPCRRYAWHKARLMAALAA